MRKTIGIVDDQKLFVSSLCALIKEFDDFEVIVEATDGKELLQKLKLLLSMPDIILVDVQMPLMDGPAVVSAIAADYPGIRTVALSMKDDDQSILKMLRAGCSGYFSKDMHPKELEKALTEIYQTGFYNGDLISIHSRRLLKAPDKNLEVIKLTEREKEFLQHACSDCSYKEIAAKMFLSVKRIDDFREKLFLELEVKSRTGMVLEAIRKNLVIFDR